LRRAVNWAMPVGRHGQISMLSWIVNNFILTFLYSCLHLSILTTFWTPCIKECSNIDSISSRLQHMIRPIMNLIHHIESLCCMGKKKLVFPRTFMPSLLSCANSTEDFAK
jgi:hypothetical protein